jgi:hypothetical protein
VAAANDADCLTASHASAGFLNLSTLYAAPRLPALFRAGSAPGVRPSELCSSRAAVRRLRRLCPLVIRKPASEPLSRNRHPRALAETETLEQPLPSDGLPQTPSPSGLCSTRKSATFLRWFRPSEARSSPGIHPLQGVLPHRKGTTFTVPPLLRLSSKAIARSFGRPFRVFLRGGMGSSRKRDRLPS